MGSENLFSDKSTSPMRMLCPVCMTALEDGVCPRCGELNFTQRAGLLPVASVVGNRYRIGAATDSNGDGVSYIAYDTQEKCRVTVREFFPDTIAGRDADNRAVLVLGGCAKVYNDCMRSFAIMWKKLERLCGLSSIIKVTDVFRENNTIYAVYSHEEAVTLGELLEREGRLSWDRLRAPFLSLLSSLAALHDSGIFHLGINLNAIKCRPDGSMLLTDFSIAQARNSMGDLSCELFDGFSALEQYDCNKKSGAWTDVYSLACVLYFAICKQRVPAISARLKDDSFTLSEEFTKAVPHALALATVNALRLSPEERTDSLVSFRDALLGKYTKPIDYVSKYYSFDDSVASLPTDILDFYRPITETPPRKNEFRPNAEPKPYINRGENQAKTTVPVHKPTTTRAVKPAAAPPKKKTKKALVLLIIPVALLCSLMLLYSFAPQSFDKLFGLFMIEEASTTEPQSTAVQVEVPVFVGRSQVSVMSDSEIRRQLNIIYVEDYSSDYAQGYIFHQTQAAGTSVDKMSDITLYVSIGPKPIIIPQVLGLHKDTARASIEGLGLVCVLIETQNDGTHTPDTVASVFPAEGESLFEHEELQVYYWGPVPETTRPTPTRSSILEWIFG